MIKERSLISNLYSCRKVNKNIQIISNVVFIADTIHVLMIKSRILYVSRGKRESSWILASKRIFRIQEDLKVSRRIYRIQEDLKDPKRSEDLGSAFPPLTSDIDNKLSKIDCKQQKMSSLFISNSPIHTFGKCKMKLRWEIW
jgi:hypothetical protein